MDGHLFLGIPVLSSSLSTQNFSVERHKLFFFPYWNETRRLAVIGVARRANGPLGS